MHAFRERAGCAQALGCPARHPPAGGREGAAGQGLHGGESAINAAAALYVMVQHSAELCQAATAAGAIPALVRLLRSSSAVTQAVAGTTLTVIVEPGRQQSEDAIAAGVLPVLLARLRTSAAEAQVAAACSVAALAVHCPDRVAAAGFAPALVRLAASGSGADPAVQKAATALGNLARGSSSLAGEVAAAGARPVLQRLQGHLDSGVQVAAAEALAALDRALDPASQAAASSRRKARSRASATEAEAAPAVSISKTAEERQAAAPRECAACGSTSGLKRCTRCGSARYCRCGQAGISFSGCISPALGQAGQRVAACEHLLVGGDVCRAH